MGAWDTGFFDNDDAADWVYVLEQAEATTTLTEAFLTVIKQEGYIELPEANIALAAARVVTILKHPKLKNLAPESVGVWCSRQRRPPLIKLSKLALKAIQQVKGDSELKGLIEDAGGLENWLELIANLEKQLKN